MTDQHEPTIEAFDQHDDEHGEDEGPVEIAITGDLTDHEAEITERLLGIDVGDSCTLYFDSPGGSPYCAMSMMTLIKLRRLNATGIVTGECSSATLWPFAACQRRYVTPYSVLLFHPMRWQSEENVGLAEAAEWARHFGDLEKTMDELLARLLGVDAKVLDKWITPGRYVSGKEVADAGIAELVEFEDLPKLVGVTPPAAAKGPGGRPQASRPAARRTN